MHIAIESILPLTYAHPRTWLALCTKIQDVPGVGQTYRPRNDQSLDALSSLLSSESIILTKAGAADTDETAWSALGLNRLASIPVLSA